MLCACHGWQVAAQRALLIRVLAHLAQTSPRAVRSPSDCRTQICTRALGQPKSDLHASSHRAGLESACARRPALCARVCVHVVQVAPHALTLRASLRPLLRGESASYHHSATAATAHHHHHGGGGEGGGGGGERGEGGDASGLLPAILRCLPWLWAGA